MKVRKAIIPAAGFGTRFLPATKAQPKEMIVVIDKPLIQYTVEEIVGAGIRRIAVITSRGKTALEDHFDRSPELESFLEEKGKIELLEEVRTIAGLAELSFIRQPDMLGLGHAILMGESFAAGEPVAALTPDDIYDCAVSCTRQLTDAFEEFGATVVALGRVDEEGTRKYGIIKVKKKISERVFELADMEEKPGPEKAFSDLAILGRYVFPPEIFAAIKATPPDSRGEIQITDAIRVLLDRQPVYGVLFEGKRYDCGHKLGFLEGTISLALKHPEFGEPIRKIIRSLLR
ncbi:MAG: UTP--glucose-1-phosphate uridylyltransferase GalU [Candidatus Aminicenantes bacterium]|nr:UTP--glucose-1-phosphate uridylyltransferase GalU [Candidatus Aminicenantes bacterium]